MIRLRRAQGYPVDWSSKTKQLRNSFVARVLACGYSLSFVVYLLYKLSFNKLEKFEIVDINNEASPY